MLSIINKKTLLSQLRKSSTFKRWKIKNRTNIKYLWNTFHYTSLPVHTVSIFRRCFIPRWTSALCNSCPTPLFRSTNASGKVPIPWEYSHEKSSNFLRVQLPRCPACKGRSESRVIKIQMMQPKRVHHMRRKDPRILMS